jgi:NADPH-dependent 2,4-dienoyl-CoA reductase/sulfur reductase-like enzyme
MSRRTVLIAGAGLAGIRCAETLRAEGFPGRVVLAGEEPVAAYERPALSKEHLAGERAAEDLALRSPAFLAERAIELLAGRRVVSVDPCGRSARLDDGSVVAWDAFVLATGARARRVPGMPVGVHVLRTVADAARLRKELFPGRRLAIVGAGFVGAEVASTARGLGLEAALVDERPPLERHLGRDVAAVLARRAVEAGIELRVGARGAGFATGADGRVHAVRLAGGSEVPCDVALLAIGAAPAAELLPGLTAPDGGVAVDACGRTGVPGVYACGDVASAWRPWLGARLRVEHWTGAAAQGAAVARAILGSEAPDLGLPYFWSDQLGLRLQHVGHAHAPARVELEGDDDSFRADYFDRRGRLLAALLANRSRELGNVRRQLGDARTALAA